MSDDVQDRDRRVTTATREVIRKAIGRVTRGINASPLGPMSVGRPRSARQERRDAVGFRAARTPRAKMGKHYHGGWAPLDESTRGPKVDGPNPYAIKNASRAAERARRRAERAADRANADALRGR